MSLNIHPTIDAGVKHGTKGFAGGTMRCQCDANPVQVEVKTQVAFNHACGCTKCWKPAGAIFSVVGVVPKDKVSVVSNSDKLQVVDPGAVIQRHACVRCGAHLFGRIENKEHAFYGLDFIHTELSNDEGWDGPGFAAFVSSVIEAGTPPAHMKEIRETLRAKGLEPYDCLSPELMDMLATHAAKSKGTFKS